MNLAEHFESQENRRKFWIKHGAEYEYLDECVSMLCAGVRVGWKWRASEGWSCDNPLSDDVKLEVLVDLWANAPLDPDKAANDWIAWCALSGAQLREALVTALMEVE